MGNFFGESNKNWKFTSIFGNFNLTTKTISNRSSFSVTNFPSVNNLKTGTGFTCLKKQLNQSVTCNCITQGIWLIAYESSVSIIKSTYNWFITASQCFPWRNIHIMIAFKTIFSWIRNICVFTNVSLNIK